MSDDDLPTRRGTILRPLRDVHSDSGRPMVVSALNRVRSIVLTKELDALTRKAQSWNGFVAALRDGERLKQEYMAAMVRSQNLDQIRLGEEAKVLADVQRIFDEELDRQRERELRTIQRELELTKAKRELEALNKPPKDEAASETTGQRRVRRIREIRADRDEAISIILAGGTEDQLSEEDRGLVNTVRLAAENEIKNLLEGSAD